MKENNRRRSKTDVLLLKPNLIGYLRIVLILIGCLGQDVLFLVCIMMSSLLDMVDGYIARRWNEESAFGEWFDVTIDLFTRGILWGSSYPRLGFLVFGIEFLVFVCTHSSGQGWQNKSKLNLNRYAAATISKGFKTLPGIVAMIGLWLLPLWCYIESHGLQYLFCDVFRFMPGVCDAVMNFSFVALVFFRLHCFFVEACVLKNHVLMLLEE